MNNTLNLKILRWIMPLWLFSFCFAESGGTISHTIYTESDQMAIEYSDRGIHYSFDDHLNTEQSGAPLIPCKIVRLALPLNTKPGAISAVSANAETIGEGFEYAWNEGDIKTDINGQYEPAVRDMDIYGSGSFYPGHYARIIDHGLSGSQPIVTLEVYPLQYRPADGTLVLAREIHVELGLEDDLIIRSNHAAFGDDPIRELTDNPGDFSLSLNTSGYYDDQIPGLMNMGIGAEYLIITSAELAPAFYPFAFWKNQKGVLTEIVLIEEILSSYSGNDPQAQIREYLKDANGAGATWVLLGGDESIIPVRYAYPGNTSEVPDLHDQQCADLYYADLTGDWDTDGDGIFGEYSQDDPDIYPEVYLGRVPAVSPEEVAIWVSKTLLYEQNPGNGDDEYLTSGLFIVNDQMRDVNEHNILAELMPDHFNVDASRCAEEPSGGAAEPTQPTGSQVIEVMDEGWGFVSNLNHGGFYYYAAMTPYYNHWPRSNLYGDTVDYEVQTTSSLSHLQETTKYGIHYSISCYTGAYDFDSGPYGPGPFITNNSFMEAYLFCLIAAASLFSVILAGVG